VGDDEEGEFLLFQLGELSSQDRKGVLSLLLEDYDSPQDVICSNPSS